jgi:hypothetical protein
MRVPSGVGRAIKIKIDRLLTQHRKSRISGAPQVLRVCIGGRGDQQSVQVIRIEGCFETVNSMHIMCGS